MDFMPLRLNFSSLTCSICVLAAIKLQLVAMECQKLHIVDLPIVERKGSIEHFLHPLLKRIDEFDKFEIHSCYFTLP